MTGVTDAGSIRLLLAGPMVLRTFAFALLGRLAYGVLPLCFLFTVRDASGSFTVAAASSATLGFATLAMPVQARLVDRHGQRRALPVYATSYAALLLLGAVLAPSVSAPAAWIGLGLLLGLTGPALGPAMRAQWREIAPEGEQRRRGYSLDSMGEESLYLVGPIVAGAVLAIGPARLGLLLAAGLVLCGTAALAASPYRPPSSGGGAGSTPAGPSLLRPLAGLLACLSLFGAGSAAVFVGIAALADRAGRPEVAGLIEAAMAAGAVAGAILWARLGTAHPSGRALATLLACLALAQALAGGAAASLVTVAALLAVGALATSPVFVIAFSAADDLVARDRRTEANTWVTVGANAGMAVGTAAAGLVAGSGGAAPFLLAAALTSVAALVALSGSRRER